MNKKLFKNKTRILIPFKEDDNEEYIEIKNPKEYTIKKVKERIINRINKKDNFDNNEILEYLINELTNIELDMPLEKLLKEDLSFECKVMLYHIMDIYNEISQECMMLMKMELTQKKTKKLEEEIISEMSSI